MRRRVEALAAQFAIEERAERIEAARDVRIFEKVLHPHGARMAESQAQHFVGRILQPNFTGEAVEGVVHGFLAG